jgi:thimet oligopeptidase
MVRDMRRMGFDLPVEERIKAKELNQRRVQLEVTFSKNINDWEDHIEVAPNQTAGLPASYLNTLAKTATGSYIVSLKYPELFPFINMADNAAKRKELSDKKLQTGGIVNMKILEELVAIRDEYAKLLGYPNHAAYRLEPRMAATIPVVTEFLEDLAQKLKSKAYADVAALEAFKREQIDEPLAYYDIAYYIHALEKKTFDIDPERIREYFPLKKVIAGTLEIYQQLLGVMFEEVPDQPLWHPDVCLYAIKEKNRDEPIAFFALDLYPREGKYGHAAAFDVFKGKKISFGTDGVYRTPFAAMVTNFRKPTDDAPSLLAHEEVSTFFHEFGHIMHETLTRAPHYHQSGVAVAWDFVEAPSQMLENWVWNAEMLKRISGHYKNMAESLPDELIQKMQHSKYFMSGYTNMRQVVLATFDMTIHQKTYSADAISKAYIDLVRAFLGISLPQDSIFPAGFGHLASYDAGYYGYLWSKVYAADMFTRFEISGLLNASEGARYRTEILEVGSSRDELESVRIFLQRDPDTTAFLRSIGL